MTPSAEERSPAGPTRRCSSSLRERTWSLRRAPSLPECGERRRGLLGPQGWWLDSCGAEVVTDLARNGDERDCKRKVEMLVVAFVPYRRIREQSP